MNSMAQSTPGGIGDAIALGIQGLRRAQSRSGGQPLLRIDNRVDAESAPFQFDTARGRIHRTGCRAIPESSKSALYGVWRFGPEDEELACPRCKPVPDEEKGGDPHLATDMLYGLLSVIDQFGGVLRERGREYRRSREGQKLEQEIGALYRGIGEREREVLQAVISSLDGIVQVVRDLDDGVNGRSDEAGDGRKSNGHDPDGTDPQDD